MNTLRCVPSSILLVGCLCCGVAAAGPSARLQAGTSGRFSTLQLDQHQQRVGLEVTHGRIQTPAAASPAPWQEQTELVARDGAAGDHLGGPVALVQGTALVGAWQKNHGAGAAYVFEQRGNGWAEQARLIGDDGRPGDWFGVTVSLSGDTALVGAPLAGRAGAAYVFVRIGSHWIQQARLIASDGMAGDWFGRAVALSGDTALVGAWYAHNDTGAAYVFVRHGKDWSEQAKLAARDGRVQDYFGTSVALNGSTGVVGAAGESDNAGTAYVFVQRRGGWTQQAKLTARDAKPGDTFGTSVALNNGTALVGAGFANRNAGAAYVFTRNGSSWKQQARLVASDGSPGDWFGRTVALSADTALVGAWYSHHDAGAAYTFVRHGGSWAQQTRLTASDGMTNDHFGTSVALSGGMGLVGAGFKNNAAGAAYVFRELPSATR